MAQPLLEVKHLKTQFRTKRGTVTAVDDVSFFCKPGDTLGIVGVRLRQERHLPVHPAAASHAVGSVAGGEIFIRARILPKKGNKEMCRIRGREIHDIPGLHDILKSCAHHRKAAGGDHFRNTQQSFKKDEIKSRLWISFTKGWCLFLLSRGKEFPHQLSGE